MEMPVMPPAMTAKMKEYIATWKTDVGSGETDMDFPTYLRTQYPDIYRQYMEGMGMGKQNHGTPEK